MKQFDLHTVMTEINFTQQVGLLNVHDDEEGECLYAQPWGFLRSNHCFCSGGTAHLIHVQHLPTLFSVTGIIV
jgi:hypothetical protein